MNVKHKLLLFNSLLTESFEKVRLKVFFYFKQQFIKAQMQKKIKQYILLGFKAKIILKNLL